MLRGEIEFALAGLDPAKARQTASHLRPGIDLACDRERLEVALPSLCRVTGQPREITEAEQRPRGRPLMVDVPGDGERRLAEPKRLGQVTAGGGSRRPGPRGIADVEPVPRPPGYPQPLAAPQPAPFPLAPGQPRPGQQV